MAFAGRLLGFTGRGCGCFLSASDPMPRACLLLLIRSCLAWSACHHRAVLRAAAFPLDRQDPGLGALPAAGVDWWAWARPRLNRRERRLRTDQFNAPLARAERMPPLGRLRQQGRSHLAAAYAPPFRAAAAHLDLHQAPRLARMALPGAAHWGSS